ncbi:MAG: hypothetical protein ACXABN_10285, partial [Candidatus Thorarchaeota archaeon]
NHSTRIVDYLEFIFSIQTRIYFETHQIGGIRFRNLLRFAMSLLSTKPHNTDYSMKIYNNGTTAPNIVR